MLRPVCINLIANSTIQSKYRQQELTLLILLNSVETLLIAYNL
jgi:hypothetical protein